MAATVQVYEFRYDTPTQVVNDDGQTVTVDVPNNFNVGGNIGDDVAKGIRYGLRQVPSIKNVTVTRVLQDRDALVGGTT